MTAIQELQEYMRVRRAEIDNALEHALPTPPDCPPLLAEAMRHSIFAGGKRFRPILTLTTADAVSKICQSTSFPPTPSSIELALPAACAIEMIHTYSLIHDDLPAMDDDTLRRGRPTAHVVYGEGLAILAGDGLLTEAFRLMAQSPKADTPVLTQRKLLVLECVAEASGVNGMVGGQAIDLQVGGQVPQKPAKQLGHKGLKSMHRRKTGALIKAAAVAGALMAGGSESIVKAIDAYATNLGLAFQIVDDILDIEGAATELGKTAGKDAAAGKATYPSMYGLEESKHLADQHIAEAQATLELAKIQGHLSNIAEWVRSRSS